MTPDVVAPWVTCARATSYLVERLPGDVWAAAVPGVPRRSVRAIAAHLHQARVRWIRQIGAVPGDASAPVDPHRVTRPELLEALGRSAAAMRATFEALRATGGVLPEFPWRNVPLDLEHFVAYHVAHEGHHRGQLVLICRQLGHRLPAAIAGGLWQWRRLALGGGDDDVDPPPDAR